MCLCRNKYFLSLFLAVCGLQLHAQTTPSGSNPNNGKDNNPYSKYGIGELLDGNNAALRGMGNISSAYASPFSINTDNPASYSFLERTTFELGATGFTRATHSTNGGVEQSYRTGTASLSYMSFAMPVSKNGGFCIGFKPYARTYYSLSDTISANTIPVSPLDSAQLIYKGEGSLNYAFLGGSVRIKGLSLGVNVGYLFGNSLNTTQLLPYDKSNPTQSFVSEYTTQTRTGGLLWKGGAQYLARIDSFHALRIGGTVSLNQKVNQHFQEYHLSGYNFGDTVIRDTAYFTGEKVGKATLPMSYSAGIIYSRDNKWNVGVDYVATQWSDFNSELNTYMNTGIAASSYRMSVGGEYTPDITDIRHVLSRSTYRVGAYTGTDYLRLSNTDISYMGFTAGISMPLRRYQTQISLIHAGIDYGILGTTDNGLMRQNYLRFTFGITMTAKWFERPKLQ